MGAPLVTITHILRDSISKCPDTEAYLGDTRLVGDAFHTAELWKLDTYHRVKYESAHPTASTKD